MLLNSLLSPFIKMMLSPYLCPPARQLQNTDGFPICRRCLVLLALGLHIVSFKCMWRQQTPTRS